MPRRSPVQGIGPPRTSIAFIVFISSLFDQVGRSEARPLSELMQSPSMPHRHIYQYRIQVNLLYFLRTYLNFFALSMLVSCFFLPWLTAALVLAGIMHMDSLRRAAIKKKSDEDDAKTPSDSSNKQQVATMVEALSPATKRTILSALQATNIIFLLYIYGVVTLLLVLTLPALMFLLHATVTPYNDASSKHYELYSKQLQEKTGGGSSGDGNDGSGGGSGGGTFTPARPSTPVRRWGPDEK